MSWSAHDLEPYAIQRHLGGRVAIIPLLLGSYSPDLFSKWFVYGLVSWRILTAEYFRTVIVPADPVWGWFGKRLPETALLALYRASFFYGCTRWVAWLIWAHVIHDFPFDLSWGGPHWVPPPP